MTAVFEKIIEMSLTSAVVIVVVMAIRLLLRKAPRKYSYTLWIVVAFRLVCPVSFRAVFSIFNFAKRLEQTEIVHAAPDPILSADPLPDGFLSTPPGMTSDPIVLDPDYVFTYPVTVQPNIPEPEVTVNLLERAVEFAAVVWLIGLAALVIYGIVSYVRLRRRMATAVLSEDGAWLSDQVQSPFILGFVKPKIYLPFGLSEDEQRYVLAHERYHLKRLDHVVRPLSFLILAVHWFNPFVWAAYYLMGADMEMSCDEKVLSTEENIRKAYSTTLLSFAANRRFPSPSPLAFGEGGVKKRIRNALNWKKPRTWVTVIAIIVCIVVIIVCAANPTGHPYDWAGSLTVDAVERAELYVTDGNPQRRELTESEIAELVAQLNQVKRGEYGTYPKNSAWGFPTERMITLTCGGVEYVLNLGSEPLTISCKDESVDWRGETDWHISNDDLKALIRGLEKPAEQIDASLDNTTCYVSVDCVYQYPPISAVMPDDSGKIYLIGEDLVAVLDKEDNDAGEYFFDLAPWQTLSVEEWDGLFMAGFAPDISGYQEPRIRRLSEEYALVDLDRTLWILHMPKSVNNGVYSAYELAAADETAVLTQWEIDLTHDGEAECIKLTRSEDGWIYDLMVENAAGEVIWSAELGTAHVGWNGFYLYEKDGQQYLMRWLPYGSTGIFSYSYEIFSLTQMGEKVPFTSGSYWYDTNSAEATLSIDVEGLKAFEAEVNTLLEDTIVLITTDEGTPYYSTQDATLCKLWTAPVSEVQKWKQDVIDRLPIVMAYMELDPILLTAVEEQVAIHMGDYDLAYVEQVQNIGGATYRVTFKPGDYDGVNRVTWQDSRQFDMVIDGDGGEGLPDSFELLASLPEEDVYLYMDGDGRFIMDAWSHYGPVDLNAFQAVADPSTLDHLSKVTDTNLSGPDYDSIVFTMKNKGGTIPITYQLIWNEAEEGWVLFSYASALGTLPRDIVTAETYPTNPEWYYKVAETVHYNLYARNHGQEIFITYGNIVQKFDHTAHTGHMNLPVMKELDERSVAVISEVNTGTGVGVDELLVYRMDEPDNPMGFNDYLYDWRDLAARFNRNNTLTYNKESNSLTLVWNGKTYSSGRLSNDLSAAYDLEDGFTGALIATGDSIRFSFNEDGAITARMQTSIAAGSNGRFSDYAAGWFWQRAGDDSYVYPLSIGETGFVLTWTVEFNGEGFDLVGEIVIGEVE